MSLLRCFYIHIFISIVSFTATAQVVERNIVSVDREDEWTKISIPLQPDAFTPPDSATFANILADVRSVQFQIKLEESATTFDVDDFFLKTEKDSTALHLFNKGYDRWSSQFVAIEWRTAGGRDGGPYLRLNRSEGGFRTFYLLPPREHWYGDLQAWSDECLEFYVRTDSDPAQLEFSLRFSSERKPELRLFPQSPVASLYTGVPIECVLADSAQSDTILLRSSDPACLAVPEEIVIESGEIRKTFDARPGYNPVEGCKTTIRAEYKSRPGYYAYTAVMLKLDDGSNDFPLLMGRVLDAVTGAVIKDARVTVGALTATTDDTGGFRIKNIDLLQADPDFYAVPRNGNAPLRVQFYDNSLLHSQSISIQAADYESIETRVKMDRDDPTIFNISLSPELEEDQYRLELHWGQRPADLDLHVLTPELSGTVYDISAQQKGQKDDPPWIRFNHDFDQGFGPEVITLYKHQRSLYRVYAENYSKYPQICESGAFFKVYSQSGLIETINIPTNGRGEIWYICDIDFSKGEIEIESVNTVQNNRPGDELASLQKRPAKSESNLTTHDVIDEWAWDLDGDGSIDSYERFPVFEYSSSGSYTVNLRIKSKGSYFNREKQAYIVVQPEVQYPTIWRPQDSGCLTELTSVCAIDSLNAWASAENGIIVRTTDGGATWERIPESDKFHFRDIAFTSHNNGWIGGFDDKNNALLLNTGNGGYNWMRFSATTENSVEEYFWINADIGYLAGTSGNIEKSVNSGLDWQVLQSGNREDLLNLYFLNADTGWVVGKYGTILYTNNGGQIWTPQSTGIFSDLMDVHFVSPKIGFVVTADGKILKTQDGGENWYDQTISDESLNSVEFINPNLGYIAGANGVILKTRNAGASWIIDNSGTTDDLNDLVVLTQTCGWAVGDNGRILKLDLSEEKPNSIQELLCETRGPDVIELSWSNPVQPEFSGCRLVRRQDAFPSNPFDGQEVYSGTAELFIDKSVEPATTYYYAAFAYDHYNRFSELQDEAFCSSTTLENVDVQGYNVTINSIDISRFPTIVSFITIVDEQTLQPVSGIEVSDLLIKEDGVQEVPVALDQINTSSGGKIDIVFVFDVTASMTQEIEDLKNRASSFADSLAAKGIDYRLGLVSFSDQIETVHDFTDDVVRFKQWIGELTPVGGGDYKENALQAMDRAGDLSFRAISQRLMILITDAEYHQAGDPGDGVTLHNTESITKLLQDKRIIADVAGPNFDQFHQLAQGTGGFYFDITSDFAQIVDHIGLIISSQYVCTYNTHNIDEDDKSRNVEVLVEKNDNGGYDFSRYRYGKAVENVSGFSATAAAPDKIYCRWRNPELRAFDGVLVLRKTDTYPKNTSDGTVVYTGKLTGFVDAGLSPETRYYYAAFAYNTTGTYARASSSSQASAVTLPVWGYDFQLNRMQSSLSEDIHRVFYKDSLNAVAVGGNGLFAVSQDGGFIWSQNPLSGNHQLYDINFTSASNALMVGKNSQNSGMILQSRDGGKTWHQQFSSSEYVFYALEFVSDSVGWAIGDKGIVKQTIDAGENWMHRYRHDPYAFYAVDFVDNSTGWVAGPLGRIMKTLDSGITWQDQVSGVTATIDDIFFIDSKHGWAVTSQGHICRTSDGGETWIAKKVSDHPLRAIAFSDLVNGYTVGDNGTLFKTRSGGNTWEKVATPVEVDLNDIALYSPLKGLIAGDNGHILQLAPASMATNLSDYYIHVNQIQTHAYPDISCYISILDQTLNTVVDNLNIDQVSLLENGLSQPIQRVEPVTLGADLPLDLVLVVNTFSEMKSKIEILKRDMVSLHKTLSAKGFTPRYGMIAFNDQVDFVSPFTANIDVLLNWFNALSYEENSLNTSSAWEALGNIADLSFDSHGQRFALFCTNVPPLSGAAGTTVDQDSVLHLLQQHSVTCFSISADVPSYRNVSESSGGLFFNINSGFESAFDLIGQLVSTQHRILFQAQSSNVKLRNVGIVVERGEKGGSTNSRFSLLSPTVSILPKEIVGINNKTVQICLSVEQMNALKSGHFRIAFDSTKLELVQVQPGAFFDHKEVSADLDVTASRGELEIDLTVNYEEAKQGMYGSGVLCFIQFRVLSEGMSKLDLNAAALQRADQSSIVALTAGAKVYPLESLVGDFDRDDDIDIQDFALFSTYWKPANDRKGDIGPASGIAPMITPSFDRVVNYEDLFVFTQMWNWFYQFEQQNDTRGKKAIRRGVWRVNKRNAYYTAVLSIENPGELSMGHVVLQYDPNRVSIKRVFDPGSTDSLATTAFFADVEAKRLDVAFARLPLTERSGQRHTRSVLGVEFDCHCPLEKPFTIKAIDLRSSGGEPIVLSLLTEPEIKNPVDYHLAQNFPNPFNQETTVLFELPEESDVTLRVVDILGRTVKVLLNRSIAAGSHKLKWNGIDMQGNAVSSGLYFLVFETAQKTYIRRMLYLK